MSGILSGNTGPYLIAHRGAMAEAPENTGAAFDRALDFPIDGIEFDVRLSRDNIPVVFHDDKLDRIAGRGGAISDHMLAELKTFDCGRWFSEFFAGTTILSLEEMLERYAHRTALLIELKTGPEGGRNDKTRRELVGRTLSLIERMIPINRQEGIFILGFDQEALNLANAAAPNLKCIRNLDRPFSFSSERLPKVDFCYGFGLALDRMTGAFIQEVHEAGKRVMTYSCNTPTQVDMALESGIDYVLTDDPASVAAHFRARIEIVFDQEAF